LVAAVERSLPKLAGALIGCVIPGRMSQPEQRMLGAIEDALRAKEAILVRYFSASRGVLSHRIVSVQKVLLGPPARCVGYCHASRALRWFRLDSFTEVERTQSEAFVEVAEPEILTFVEASIDGFAQGERRRVAFRVRNPEARWVAGNLPAGLTARPDNDGIRVEADTAGLVPIARFVVGIGDAAAVETPELAAAVRELAQGALRALDAAQGGQAFSAL
jgi:predicted DNA-binding transcriptional regulator YafY